MKDEEIKHNIWIKAVKQLDYDEEIGNMEETFPLIFITNRLLNELGLPPPELSDASRFSTYLFWIKHFFNLEGEKG